MIIEFHTQGVEVEEWMIDYIKQKLTDYYTQDREITRADIYFHRHPGALDGEYGCEIVLTVFDSSLTVQHSADSYNVAVNEVIRELSRRVKEMTDDQKELPGEHVYLDAGQNR
jgi:ribosomal subunit interface protein